MGLDACSSIPPVQDRQSVAVSLAEKHGWGAETLPSVPFPIVAWVPRLIRPDSDLTIYIEGDGFAWEDSTTPSRNPTPINPVGLKLALAQPKGNAVSLARPCQYQTFSSSLCSERYWTQARFAPDVVASMDEAVNQVKARFGATRLTLVGYSGGAAIAALLAERRADIVRLVTVAGNLDHRAWTQRHRLTPLDASLNPADEKERLNKIPQTHFAGGRDDVVPPDLSESFVAHAPHAQVIVIKDYDHACCWDTNWAKLWLAIR